MSDYDDSIFKDDIDWAYEKNITRGPTDRYRPDDNVTRGEMAAFLHRTFDASATRADDIAKWYNARHLGSYHGTAPEPEPEPGPEPEPPTEYVVYDGTQNYETWDDDRTLWVRDQSGLGNITLRHGTRNVMFSRCEAAVIAADKDNPGNVNNIRILNSYLKGVYTWGNTDGWHIEHCDIGGGSYCIGAWQRDNRGPSNLRIYGNRIHTPSVDAIQLNAYSGVEIFNNEFTGIVENGEHNDGIQTVWGGQGLIVAENWFHHNKSQDLFVGKDGKGNEYRGLIFSNNIIENVSGPMHSKIYPISGKVVVANNTVEGQFTFRGGGWEYGGKVENYSVVGNDFQNLNVEGTFPPGTFDNASGSGADWTPTVRSYGPDW